MINSIYNNSPIWLQNAMLSLYGIKLNYERHGKEYGNYLGFLMQSQWYGSEQFYELQLESLKEFLLHAYTNVTYYRDLFNSINLRPSDIKTIEDLEYMPILEKSVFRSNSHLFKAQNYKPRNLVTAHTSGTTGTPMTIYKSRCCLRKRRALLERFYRWCGVFESNKSARFSGKTIIPPNQTSKVFWRYNLAGNQILFSTYHMSDENLKYYVDKLNKLKPVYIDGYPSALYILAKYMERKGLEGYITPKAIMTTAETLLDNQRDVIEKVFKTKIYDQYASAEGAPFITECEYGNLHINPESGIFEILKSDGTSADYGEIGNLVVTSFTTKAMPLIRYKIGDLSVRKKGNCSCGRKMPLIEEIIGRVEDVLYTNQRGYVGRLSPIFKKLPNSIIEVQIIQESIDKIKILIVPDPAKFQNSHLDILEGELRNRLGDEVYIEKEIVESIPRSSSGKFKAVISKLQMPWNNY